LIRILSAVFIVSLLLTGCPMPGGEGGAGNSPLTFLPFILIFVLFYFLILRPQQKQGKKRDEMLKNLKRGDNVITSGGIFGKIQNISEEDVVTLEVSKGVSIRISRSGIAGLQGSDTEKEDKSKK